MLRKNTNKGQIIWHRQFGRAIFINWYDEAKTVCRVLFANRGGIFIFNRSELHNTANKIKDLKPGWYNPDSSRLTHFFSPVNNGDYRSACGKVKIPGGALTPEQDCITDEKEHANPAPTRCSACEKATRNNGMKTTLFDYSK